MAHRPRYILEYLALRGLAAFIGRMPYRMALAVAWALAALSYAMVGDKRRRTIERLRAVLGPEPSDAAVRKTAWLATRNLFFNGAEILRFPHMDRRWIDRYVDGSEVPRAFELLRQHGAYVVAMPHAGNWELGGQVTSRLGLPLFAIAKRQKNPLTDAYFHRIRQAADIEFVDSDAHLFRVVLRTLHQGRILTILPDIRSRQKAVPVRFLGGEANVYAGMAMFARQAHAPILPATVLREGWTHHRFKVFDPVFPDPAVDKRQDWRRMTQEVMDCFDRHIREHPDQYFWFNKNWILDPPSET